MILKITEYCAWENERWSYLIDLNKQEGAVLNLLMIFIRLANAYYETANDEAQRQPMALAYHPIFNPHPRNPFAASKYNFEFYDSLEETKRGIKVVNSNGSLWLSDHVGYHSATNLMLDRKISIAKIKSAVISIRKRKTNSLYKSFDSIFLKQKAVV